MLEILVCSFDDFERFVVSKLKETYVHAGKEGGVFESCFISDFAFVVLVLMKFLSGDLAIGL